MSELGGPHSATCKWCKKGIRGAFSKQRVLDRYAAHLRVCKVAQGALEKVNADSAKANPAFVPRTLERFIELFITVMGGTYSPPPPKPDALPKLEQLLKPGPA